jgi:hypothetical protein
MVGVQLRLLHYIGRIDPGPHAGVEAQVDEIPQGGPMAGEQGIESAIIPGLDALQ